MIILMIMTLSSMGLLFINKYFLFIPPIFGIIAIIFRKSHKNYLFEIQSLESEIGDLAEREKSKENRLIYIENYQRKNTFKI